MSLVCIKEGDLKAPLAQRVGAEKAGNASADNNCTAHECKHRRSGLWMGGGAFKRLRSAGLLAQ